MLCSFPGCDNPKSLKAAKGLCSSHYWQLHKGRELTPLSYRRNRCLPWLEEHASYAGYDCLIWPFQRNSDGYPQVKYQGKQRTGISVMCEMAHGPKPSSRHEAAHSCGRGHEGCINPNHLRWATPTENAADKFAHGTHREGVALPHAKLDEQKVREIRKLAGSVSQAKLAALYGVAQSQVFNVIHRKTWAHVDG